MENQLLQFKQKFVEDASGLIDQLESDLILLEGKPENQDLIQAIFRCMHTLKGVSSMYGFDNIADITHKIESLYELMRDDKLKVNSQIIQLTLTSADCIRNLLHGSGTNTDEDAKTLDIITGKITQIIENAGFKISILAVKKKKISKSGSCATWQIIFKPQEGIFTRNINLINTFKDLFELGSYNLLQADGDEDSNKFIIFLVTDKSFDDIDEALFFIIEYCRITKIADFDIFNEAELEKNDLEIKSTIAYNNKIAQNTDLIEESDDSDFAFVSNDIKINEIVKSRINVEASKLDELMYLVSELITTNSQLAIASKDRIFNPIRPIFEKIDTLSKQFRNNTLNLRLVPINEMLVKFKRLVRDLSQALGKDVELVTQGTETELDKSTIDALADPVMHLIRNCIDHGIETPEIRIAQNKTPKGMIKITAFHSGNFVFIQVQDDGQGIDVEKIRQKAISKNIVSAEAELTEQEANELIFLPGFSTAESLTQVSGRGVGMDVVKKKVTELRGQIEINSEKGLGTSFTIKLHQTIAILDTMLFQLDDLFFLVPLSDVEECRLIDYNELEQRKNTSTIPHNNQLIPYIDLYDLFKLKNKKARKLKLLIINRQEKHFAIAADNIIGEHQAVLKSIGEAAKKQPYLAVASVLGNGNLAYLLDMTMLQQNFLTKTLNN